MMSQAEQGIIVVRQLRVTWATNSALIQIMLQHNEGEFLQIE